ncbi:hypothetical protein [Anaerobacillus arseniciselenatis]|nr:hypothetical protein [Anaerobacillus arseniciselenatis]
MEKGYYLADLTENEKEKLSKFEEELGIVLIAWEKDAEGNNEV